MEHLQGLGAFRHALFEGLSGPLQECLCPPNLSDVDEKQRADVFMSIANESLGSGFRQDLLFNPVVLLAVVSELARQKVSIVRTAVSSLWTLLEPKLLGYRHRPWGVAFGVTGFTNAIQDLSVSGLFKPGQRHKEGVGFHLFAEEWQPVLPGGPAEPGDIPDCGGT